MSDEISSNEIKNSNDDEISYCSSEIEYCSGRTKIHGKNMLGFNCSGSVKMNYCQKNYY